MSKMSTIVLGTALTLGALGASSVASAGVHVGVSAGLPLPVIAAPAPVVVAPPVVPVGYYAPRVYPYPRMYGYPRVYGGWGWHGAYVYHGPYANRYHRW